MHVLDSVDVHRRLTFDMKRVGHCLYEQRSCCVSGMESDEAGSLCTRTHLECIYSSVKQTPSAPSLHNKIVHASGSAAPVQVPFRCIYAHINMHTACLDTIVAVPHKLQPYPRLISSYLPSIPGSPPIRCTPVVRFTLCLSPVLILWIDI